MAKFDQAWLGSNADRVIHPPTNREPRRSIWPEPRPMPERLVPSEQALQRAVMEWVSWAKDGPYPELCLLFHPANGEYRPKKTGGILRTMGVSAGVPDLLLLHPSGPFHGLAVELKHGLNDLSPVQTSWMVRLHEVGWAVTSCWTEAQVRSVLVEYLTDPENFVGGI